MPGPPKTPVSCTVCTACVKLPPRPADHQLNSDFGISAAIPWLPLTPLLRQPPSAEIIAVGLAYTVCGVHSIDPTTKFTSEVAAAPNCRRAGTVRGAACSGGSRPCPRPVATPSAHILSKGCALSRSYCVMAVLWDFWVQNNAKTVFRIFSVAPFFCAAFLCPYPDLAVFSAQFQCKFLARFFWVFFSASAQIVFFLPMGSACSRASLNYGEHTQTAASPLTKQPGSKVTTEDSTHGARAQPEAPCILAIKKSGP